MVSLIVAVSENGVIGRQGHLPWRLSVDLQRFKRLTMGHHLVMGRKTFESIGRLLPGRVTVVLSRQPDFSVPAGALQFTSLAAALENIRDTEIFVVGGEEVYRSALPTADRLYLTRVHTQVEGDAFFPPVDLERQWRPVTRETHSADPKNQFAHTFAIYERRRAEEVQPC